MEKTRSQRLVKMKRSTKLADEVAVEAAVEAELAEQEVLAEVAAEIAAAAGNADAETMSSHGGDGIDSESDDVPNGMSQSETVVVEISGVGGQTIRLSLPATSESENLTPTETMVSYDRFTRRCARWCLD